MSQFESMLPPESERDSMADTIISQFKERFSELDQSTGILSSAVGRASDTVTSLRVLSGVDGVSYEPTDFETIWEGFRRRSPQLAMSYDVSFGDSDTVHRCHGSSVAYAIAIELVLSKAEALDLDVDSVRLIPSIAAMMRTLSSGLYNLPSTSPLMQRFGSGPAPRRGISYGLIGARQGSKGRSYRSRSLERCRHSFPSVGFLGFLCYPRTVKHLSLALVISIVASACATTGHLKQVSAAMHPLIVPSSIALFVAAFRRGR